MYGRRNENGIDWDTVLIELITASLLVYLFGLLFTSNLYATPNSPLMHAR
jgi:hypothetical protein